MRSFTDLRSRVRPLGSPVVWGGAGPDYPDRTPILLGATDPSFNVHCSTEVAASSFGHRRSYLTR
jgi:hypothetical protein